MIRPNLRFAAKLCALLLLATPSLALDRDQAIALATTDSRTWCEGEGGKLELEKISADPVDLTGDGSADDWIVVEDSLFCGPDLGYLGGSGGVMLHAIVGEKQQSWLGGAWSLQTVTFTVEGETQRPVPTLILGLHGSACDSFGAAPCLLALTWDGENLIHFRDPLPNEAEADSPEN